MRFIYILLIPLLAVSCSETKMLQKSLSNYEVSMGYLHDSEITKCAATDSVALRISNNSLDSLLTVAMIKSRVYPFIFFNYSEVNMKVRLGQNILERPYADFFTASLMEESKRTGCFAFTNQPKNDSVYTLDISIDSCKTHSNYQKSSTVIFLVFAYSMSYSESGSPAETNLYVTATLRKGDFVVSKKSYSVKREQPFLNSKQVNIEKLRSDFAANMVESLCFSTKQCVEEMIADLNNTLKK